MNDDIKITMLGAPATGKTCFLLGMYAVMREGVRGFTFATQDPDVDLELSDRWDQLVIGTGGNRWPQGNNDKPVKYMFNFNYGFSPLMGFEWMDYRGGALKDQASKADVQELRDHLRSSASVFLCISGQDLASKKGINYVRARNMTGRMAQLLGGLEPWQKPSVVIVLTKYDYCRSLDKREVLDMIREMFTPLYAPGAEWLVTVCPVSLGMELANDQDGGAIDPKATHLPVAFAIYSAFRKLKDEAESDIRSRNDRAQDLGRNWFLRLLNSREIALNAEAKLNMERNREQIAKNIDLLSQELVRGVQVYYNGKEVDLDI